MSFYTGKSGHSHIVHACSYSFEKSHIQILRKVVHMIFMRQSWNFYDILMISLLYCIFRSFLYDNRVVFAWRYYNIYICILHWMWGNEWKIQLFTGSEDNSFLFDPRTDSMAEAVGRGLKQLLSENPVYYCYAYNFMFFMLKCN